MPILVLHCLRFCTKSVPNHYLSICLISVFDKLKSSIYLKFFSESVPMVPKLTTSTAQDWGLIELNVNGLMQNCGIFITNALENCSITQGHWCNIYHPQQCIFTTRWLLLFCRAISVEMNMRHGIKFHIKWTTALHMLVSQINTDSMPSKHASYFHLMCSSTSTINSLI